MLKRSLFLCLFVLCRWAAAAGQTEVLFEPKALFPAQGGPGVKLLFLPNGSAFLIGGSGSVLMGNNAGIGAGGYSLADQYLINTKGEVRDLGLTFGGLVFDYSILPKRLFYLNSSTMGGIGQAYAIRHVPNTDRISANFGFVDQQFNIMLNVTRELRVALGVGVFIAQGTDLAGTIGTDVSGANFQLVLFYGKL